MPSDPNVTPSPHLGLPIPNLNDPGPAYAQNINTCLLLIDGTVAGVNGALPVDLSKQFTSGNISLDNFNLSNTRSVQLNNNPSVLTGSQDLNCVYITNNIIGFNDHNGIFQPFLTPSTIGSLSFLNFAARIVTSSTAILYTDTYNLVEVDTTGGAVTVTLPLAAQLVPFRLYAFRDIGGAATEFNITIRVPVSSGNAFADTGSPTFVINNNGGYVLIYTDGVNRWFTWGQNVFNGENLYMNGGNINLNNTSILSSLSFDEAQASPTIFQKNAVTTPGTPHPLTISAQFTTGTTVGGNLVLNSGGGASSAGLVLIQLAGNANSGITVSPTAVNTYHPTIVNSSDTITLGGGSGAVTITGSTIGFAAGDSSPSLFQANTTSATPQALTIAAQGTSGSTVGGNLVLISGAGTSSYGSVILQLAGLTHTGLAVTPTGVINYVNTTFNANATVNGTANLATMVGNIVTYATRAVSSDYTIDSAGSDYYILANSGGTLTVTTPTNTVGRTFVVKNPTTHVVIVSAATGTIDGFASISLGTTNQALVVFGDGTNWFTAAKA